MVRPGFGIGAFVLAVIWSFVLGETARTDDAPYRFGFDPPAFI